MWVRFFMISSLVTSDWRWGFAQGSRHPTAKGKHSALLNFKNAERNDKTQKGKWRFVAVSITSVSVDTLVQMNHSGCVPVSSRNSTCIRWGDISREKKVKDPVFLLTPGNSDGGCAVLGFIHSYKILKL